MCVTVCVCVHSRNCVSSITLFMDYGRIFLALMVCRAINLNLDSIFEFFSDLCPHATDFGVSEVGLRFCLSRSAARKACELSKSNCVNSSRSSRTHSMCSHLKCMPHSIIERKIFMRRMCRAHLLLG